MVFDGFKFITQFNIDHETKDLHRGWVSINCPFCSDKSKKLGLNLYSGTFKCFRCGGHLTIEVIEKVLKVSRPEAAAVFRSFISGTGRRFERKKASGKKVDVPPQFFKLPGERSYLKKRGIWDPEIIERYGLRGGGIHGKWAYRIVVPIFYENQIVSAVGRDWSGQAEIPYLTLTQEEQIIDPKTIFLGLDHVPGNEVAVVEGPFDAIRGGPGFIASFGAAFTAEQLYLLSMYKTVHFVLDNDRTGIQANHRYAEHLDALGVDVDIITWKGTEKDTGEFLPQSIQDLREFIGFDVQVRKSE